MINLMFPSADTQISDSVVFLEYPRTFCPFHLSSRRLTFYSYHLRRLLSYWWSFSFWVRWRNREIIFLPTHWFCQTSNLALWFKSKWNSGSGWRTQGWAAGRCLAPALPSSKAPEQRCCRENRFSSRAELLWMGSLCLSWQTKRQHCPVLMQGGLQLTDDPLEASLYVGEESAKNIKE